MHKFLKKLWLWTAVDRATKRLVGFQIGTRETRYFQKLAHKIGHVDAKFYASDHWHAYNLVEPTKHLTGKAHTVHRRAHEQAFASLSR